MEEEYKKIMRVKKLSKIVGWLNKFQARRLEVLLIIGHLIQILLNIINLLIIPWNVLKTYLKGFRIFILCLILYSLLIISFNKIFRNRKKIHEGNFYKFSLYNSYISICSIVFSFFFTIIFSLVTINEIKNYKKKNFDRHSILLVDVFISIVHIILFFLWYAEILRIMVKTDAALNLFLDARARHIESQNVRVVNVELKNKNNVEGDANYGQVNLDKIQQINKNICQQNIKEAIKNDDDLKSSDIISEKSTPQEKKGRKSIDIASEDTNN